MTDKLRDNHAGNEQNVRKKRKWDVSTPPADTEPVDSPDTGKKSKIEDALERATAAASRILPQTAPLAAIKRSEATEGLSQDVSINDVRNRYLLTKASTQAKIKEDTGADVTTRGKYYPDQSLATDRDPPLYLHVSATSQQALDDALQRIDDIIHQPPPVAEQRNLGPSHASMPNKNAFHEKVMVGLEADRMFNVRAKIVGPSGQYVKHIQHETSTKVQLKGRGSMFLDAITNQESDEPLHIHIMGNSQEAVDSAKRLCQDLIDTVKAEYARMRQQRASRPGPTAPMYGNPPPNAGQAHMGHMNYGHYPQPTWGPEYAGYYPGYEAYYSIPYTASPPPPGPATGPAPPPPPPSTSAPPPPPP
ncbi:hypothetical protein DFS34DRAFT_219157 [Phlyctochytrium arcticum]|nr:hypothetical protein DFS34DRAFT_219157 [Phlyctochytrium arcticum]